MSLRYLLALATVYTCAIPALAQTVKPTVVATSRPLSQLLGEYREMIRQIGGPAHGDGALKEFDDGLKEKLGEQGFEGLDINRPLAAYAVIDEKIENTNPVLIVPVTGEKEFVAFLKRLKFEATAVKDKKGLYHLRVRGLDFLPNESHVQFVDSWAYIGLNGDSVAEAKTRLSVDGLFDNADLSLFTVKIFPGNFPEKLLKKWLEDLDNTANSIKGFAGGGAPPYFNKLFTAFFEGGPKLVRRYGETGNKEVEIIRLKFSWDPNTGDSFTEAEIVPKAGSSLAKEIADKVTGPQRFSGFIPQDAVLGAVLKGPLYAKEIREIVTGGIAAIEGGLKTTEIPQAYHPILEEVAKSAIQNVKKGNLDLAFALTGPDKDEKFTLVAATTLGDTSAIDKAIRTAAKSVNDAKEFELDIDKVGGVSIHKVPLFKMLPEDILREMVPVFGEYPPGYIAVDKDAGFVSFGPDGLAAIKAALASKPGQAPVLEVVGNPKRVQKLIASVGAKEQAGLFGRLFPNDEKLVSLLRVSVENGKTLKAKATLNLRYLPRLQFIP